MVWVFRLPSRRNEVTTDAAIAVEKTIKQPKSFGGQIP